MSTRSTTLGIRLVALLAVLGRFCAADDAFDKLFSAGNYSEAIKYADDKIPVEKEMLLYGPSWELLMKGRK